MILVLNYVHKFEWAQNLLISPSVIYVHVYMVHCNYIKTDNVEEFPTITNVIHDVTFNHNNVAL